MTAGVRRSACLAGIVFSLGCSPALALELADEPVALAWSADEVQAAGLGTLAQTLKRATQRDELGCQQHCERLQQVFDRLVAEARQQTPRARLLPWSLVVVRTPEVDAFALPDGQVVISESLIEDRGLSTEALAFVLAHEMAHSLLQHERQVLTAGRMLLPRAVPRSVDDMYVELAHNRGLVHTLEPVLHQTELEADEVGLLLAALCGYAPNRQIEFMQNEVAEDPGAAAFDATHPRAALRLARLEERLPLAWRLYEQGRRSTGPGAASIAEIR